MGYLNRVGAYIKAHSFDLLWIEKELFPWVPAWAERILNLRGIPYVVDYDDAVYLRYSLHRDLLIRTLLSKNIDTAMQRAATVVVGNNYLGEYARQAGASKIEYLPTVIDIDRFPISEKKGKQFRNVLDWELCWYFETRHFLKGGSRVLAMADYKAEKALVLAVPHRFLIGEPEQIAAPYTPTPAPRQRRPRGCPF